jgi:hypothetical protein
LPIVRDWPLLSPFNGAHRAFPMCEIINDELLGARLIEKYSQNFDAHSFYFQECSDIFFESKIPDQYIDFIKKVYFNA